MYKTKENFLYWKEGHVLTADEEKQFNNHIPAWLENHHIGEAMPEPKPEPEVKFDLNGDGKFDDKDVKIAAQVMRAKQLKSIKKKKK